MEQKPQFNISLKEVKSIFTGHGIQLWYIKGERLYRNDKNSFIFAYISGFAWKRDSSKIVEIHVLKPNAKEFRSRGIDGEIIITEMRESIVSFLQGKDISPHKISEHIYAWSNA